MSSILERLAKDLERASRQRNQPAWQKGAEEIRAFAEKGEKEGWLPKERPRLKSEFKYGSGKLDAEFAQEMNKAFGGIVDDNTPIDAFDPYIRYDPHVDLSPLAARKLGLSEPVLEAWQTIMKSVNTTQATQLLTRFGYIHRLGVTVGDIRSRSPQELKDFIDERGGKGRLGIKGARFFGAVFERQIEHPNV